MVLAIGSEIETITPPVPARDAASTRWEAIDPWGTTPLYDATLQALDAIQTRQGRRALVLISDGIDRDSTTTATELIEHARRKRCARLSGRHRRDAAAACSASSRTSPAAAAFFVEDPKRLEAQLATLARELRFQYLLGYTPTRPRPAESGSRPPNGGRFRSRCRGPTSASAPATVTSRADAAPATPSRHSSVRASRHFKPA